MRGWSGILVGLLAVASTAMAAETVRFGNRIIGVGDNVGNVIQVAGKPDREVQLENRMGGAVAMRWEYYRDGKTILVTVQGGRVTSIDIID